MWREEVNTNWSCRNSLFSVPRSVFTEGRIQFSELSGEQICVSVWQRIFDTYDDSAFDDICLYLLSVERTQMITTDYVPNLGVM